MKNIPFPNPHDADALNNYLDELAAGKHVTPGDEVQETAATMHALANQSMPSVPESKSRDFTGGNQMQTAAYSPPISNRTRKAGASLHKEPRWNAWVSGALVAALLVSLISYAWWNGPGGSDDSNNIAWAPGTVTPMEQQLEPLNPETSPWMADFDSADCTQVSELYEVVIDYAAMPEDDPQAYGVDGDVNTDESEKVVDQYRAMRGCDRLGKAWAYWTESRIYEHPRTLNEQNRAEISELQEYFAALYPQQFMGIGTDISVNPAMRSEWASREEIGIVGQPIPLDAKLNPEWAVKLSDDRIAFPATTMYSADDPAIIANGLPVRNPASTVVMIFSLEDGFWKYDDSLAMCLVNCEAGMNNPLDVEENSWAKSIESKSCSSQPMQPDLPYGSDLSDLTYTDRAYGPVGPASSEAAARSSTTVDSWYACGASGDDQFETQTYMTPLGALNLARFENGGIKDPFEAAPYLRQWEQGTHSLLAQTARWNQLVVLDEPIRTTQFGMMWTPMMSGSDTNSATLRSMILGFSPTTATELEDGRVAIFAVSMVSVDDRGAITYEGNRPFQQVTGVILQQHNDQWLIDEAIVSENGTILITKSDEWWWDASFDPTPEVTPES